MYTASLPSASAERIPCRITLRTADAATLYGIVSPRTGNRLEVAREHMVDLPRLAGRIVQAVSRGMRATFTPDELRAFAEVARRQAEAERAVPMPIMLRYWGRSRRRKAVSR